MLQVFYLDIAYVVVAIHVCCKFMFQMFHLFETYVASVSSGCYICFKHILQASIPNVSYVSDICCMRVYLVVLVAIYICCKHMFVYVSHVSDVCCRSAFMLQH
jgi:hypothetical protein